MPKPAHVRPCRAVRREETRPPEQGAACLPLPVQRSGADPFAAWSARSATRLFDRCRRGMTALIVIVRCLSDYGKRTGQSRRMKSGSEGWPRLDRAGERSVTIRERRRGNVSRGAFPQIRRQPSDDRVVGRRRRPCRRRSRLERLCMCREPGQVDVRSSMGDANPAGPGMLRLAGSCG